jgi:uncharacterized OB-fold protein
MQPAQTWRHNQEIKKWLGKAGRVTAVTRIRTSSPELAPMTPYSYTLVNFGETKKELMATGHDKLKIGDKVECVLRKINLTDTQGIIEYGLKVKKLKETK